MISGDKLRGGARATPHISRSPVAATFYTNFPFNGDSYSREKSYASISTPKDDVVDRTMSPTLPQRGPHPNPENLRICSIAGQGRLCRRD